MTSTPAQTQPAGAPTTTSSKSTKVLGVATLVGLALLLLYSFVISKPEETLGETVRIMYVHVPAVSIAYLLMIANAIASGWYLARKSAFADTLAGATGELGTLFLGLALVTGMLWGRPTWGTYWEWDDPRLATTALLMLMYIGYVGVRSLPGDRRVRGTRSAVVGVLSALMIYPVHMAVTWRPSIHQGATIGRDTQMGGTQLFSLFLGFITFLLLAAWLVVHRFRVGWLADQLDDIELDSAIAARRAEALPGGIA